MQKDPLLTVLKLAFDAEEKAALQLKSAQLDKQKYQTQLDVLNNYRLDYMKQMGDQQGKTLSANQYSQFHQFIKQVDNAIAQQVNAVKDAEVQVSYRQKNWLEKQQKRKAVDWLTKPQNWHTLKMYASKKCQMSLLCSNLFEENRDNGI
jgi:flagellar FliJ protein